MIKKRYPQNKKIDCIGKLDTRIDELLIELTRYLVLFGMSMLFAIFDIIVWIAFGDDRKDEGKVKRDALLSVGIMLHVGMLMHATFLIWKFNHWIYLKLCCCAECVLNRLRQRQMRQQNQQNNYQEFLL